MTLPASFLSMQQIATELGLSLPLSLNHPWVIALAGKSALPVSFSDLLGKTAQFNGSVTFQMGSGGSFGYISSITSLGAFFGGSGGVLNNMFDTSGNSAQLVFSVAPNWSGNIKVTNQTTGASAILTKQNATTWQTTSAGTNTIPGNALPAGGTTTATMLIQPSN